MTDSLHALRTRIERFYASAGHTQLERWRGAAPVSAVGHSRLSRELVSDESNEALEAARASGRIDGAQHGWLDAHLSRIRLGLALAQRRTRFVGRSHDALQEGGAGGDAVGRVTRLLGSSPGTDRSELSRTLELLAEPLVADWIELLAVLRERVDGPPPADLQDRLTAFLKATDALADELVGRLRLATGRRSRPWAELLTALRAPELNQFTAARERHRRVATAFAGLGFAPDMARCLTVEAAVLGVSPTPELSVIDAPNDIRIGPPHVEYGVWADQAMARALGAAVALALVSPDLAAEQRWPLPGGCGLVLGGLFAQLLADPLCTRRVLGYSARDAERVARHHAALLVLTARARCAVALAGPGRDGRDGLDRLEHGMERALRIPVPGSLAALFGARPEAWRQAEAALQSLALGVELRERFDDDWFRNPQPGTVIRGVCVQGNAGTTELLDLALEVTQEGRTARAAARALELAAP